MSNNEYWWCDRCYEDITGQFYLEAVGWDDDFDTPIVEFVCRECATNEERGNDEDASLHCRR